jgi:hypothetical protein
MQENRHEHDRPQPSGPAIGITVAGTGGGLHYPGFAVPINEALAVAKSIEASHSGAP